MAEKSGFNLPVIWQKESLCHINFALEGNECCTRVNMLTEGSLT